MNYIYNSLYVHKKINEQINLTKSKFTTNFHNLAKKHLKYNFKNPEKNSKIV